MQFSRDNCQSGVWVAGSKVAAYGTYNAPGNIAFTLERPGVLIVSGDVWRSPISSQNDGIIGLVINGSACAIDRSIEGIGTNAHASASCVRYLPAGNHSVGASNHSASYTTLNWSYVVMQM